jgi:hypothetical protein
VKTISEKGLAGVWQMVLDKISGLEDLVINGIKFFITDTVVKKGIEFVLSLFNPAGAFVEAVEMIIDVIQFFIQKGKQIQQTVDKILDSVESLLGGGEGGVPAMIEATLAGTIPMVIQFLADLVGLGDLGTTIKGLVDKARALVDGAIDWLVDKIVGLAKAIWSKLTGRDKDAKNGEEDGRSAVEREAALSSAMSASQALLEDPTTTVAQVKQKLPSLQEEHKVKHLELVVDEEKGEKDTVHMEGANSPLVSGPQVEKPKANIQRLGDGSGESAQTDNSPVTANGPTADVAEFSEATIAKLTAEARGEAVLADAAGLRLRLSYQEKGQFSRAAKLSSSNGKDPEKTVAHGNGIEALSGWGIEADFRTNAAGPLTEHQASLANIAAGQKAGTYAGIPKGTIDPSLVPSPDDLYIGPGEDAPAGAAPQTAGKDVHPDAPSLSAQTGGVEGQYEASHAERQVYERSGGAAQAIGVTRAPCPTCVAFFTNEAKSKKTIIVIAYPGAANVFLPNGTVETR